MFLFWYSGVIENMILTDEVHAFFQYICRIVRIVRRMNYFEVSEIISEELLRRGIRADKWIDRRGI